MKRSVAVLAIVSALGLSGCAEKNATSDVAAPQAAHERRGALDVSALRIMEADFQALPSPEALAEVQSIVAVGVVDGWQEGPALASYPNGPLEHRIFLRIKVTQPLKGVKDGKLKNDSLVFVDLYRGAVVRDESKKPEEWLPRKSPENFEKSIPAGTRATVFVNEHIPYEGAVVKPGAALPENAVLTSPPPQGLVFEDQRLVQQNKADGQVIVGGIEPLDVAGTRSGWLEPKNMDELIARLKLHGFSG
ncbi:hypothetical protein [Streptosporangium carneum]|uniref:Lipoprotein n=1 Tax=Streptosporangium carneum TaxID=47481 RepID=A0A9W6I8C2_9ACTN|nr:hypothetical protein [Streptosporangium carneum]GLK13251.1 hypothetical protein GCM10017600_66620 [Streptosporangium carneum]